MDPIHNNVFIPVAQYPLDPSSASTGQPGIMVFHDPAPAQTVLGSFGTAEFALQGRTMNVTAVLKGVADAPTELHRRPDGRSDDRRYYASGQRPEGGIERQDSRGEVNRRR